MIELVPFFFLVFYLVPFMVAVARDHDVAGGVFLLNLLTGWTILGWLAALAWAMAPTTTAWSSPSARRTTPDVGRARDVMPRILDAGSRE